LQLGTGHSINLTCHSLPSQTVCHGYFGEWHHVLVSYYLVGRWLSVATSTWMTTGSFLWHPWCCYGPSKSPDCNSRAWTNLIGVLLMSGAPTVWSLRQLFCA
jgi:hypothetical protein